jgi:hypothetical protein
VFSHKFARKNQLPIVTWFVHECKEPIDIHGRIIPMDRLRRIIEIRLRNYMYHPDVKPEDVIKFNYDERHQVHLNPPPHHFGGGVGSRGTRDKGKEKADSSGHEGEEGTMMMEGGSTPTKGSNLYHLSIPTYKDLNIDTKMVSYQSHLLETIMIKPTYLRKNKNILLARNVLRGPAPSGLTWSLLISEQGLRRLCRKLDKVHYERYHHDDEACAEETSGNDPEDTSERQ